MTSGTSFRAFLAEEGAFGFRRGVVELGLDDLPSDGTLIKVRYSSINFKDALASSADGRVARSPRLVPGIDLAGAVAGTERAVLAHGYELGVSRHGGFGEMARVPEEWLVELPDGLSLRDVMVIGTAGFTAALSVIALEDHGISPDGGPVLVTGATGGVGSIAVGILAARGYEVVASTGKPEAHGFLSQLGATSVLPRAELLVGSSGLLESARWAGAIDCIGGPILANVLKQMRYGGVVAASGLTGGVEIHTTVVPFILRRVSLIGIDSVHTPIAQRRAVWSRLGSDLRPRGLDHIGYDVSLEEIDQTLDHIQRGEMTGRAVLDLRPNTT